MRIPRRSPPCGQERPSRANRASDPNPRIRGSYGEVPGNPYIHIPKLNVVGSIPIARSIPFSLCRKDLQLSDASKLRQGFAGPARCGIVRGFPPMQRMTHCALLALPLRISSLPAQDHFFYRFEAAYGTKATNSAVVSPAP